MTEPGPYNALVREYFERPRNVASGPWPGSQRGAAGRVAKGLWLGFQLLPGPDGKVVAARFRAYGCPHAIALASWLTDWLPGRTLAPGFQLDRAHVIQVLDLPVEKTHCLVVAEDAIRNAIEDDGGRE